MITVAIDAMGGDNAPHAIVEGSIQALREFPQIRVILAGPVDKLTQLLAQSQDVMDRIEIRDAKEVITNHDSPVMAIRKKPNSSLVVAIEAIKSGDAQALVSAGSTGAVLAGGMFKIGRIKGIERPALAPVLPGVENPMLLIDCGANVDCKPEYLVQFGMMGSVYMENVLGFKNPSVGLINIGDEPGKGNELVKQTFPLMQKQSYNFIGNIEARDIPQGKVNVLVADGFAGNIILKFMEGLASALMSMLKVELIADIRSKIGTKLVMPALKRFKKRLDYTEYGGAPLLGVEGAVVKAHGSSDAYSFRSAIKQAILMVEGDVVNIIRSGVENLNVES